MKITIPKLNNHHIILIFAGFLVSLLSGCGLFQAPCGFDCEARHICNGLNQNFFEDKRKFEIARRTTNNELARFYCIWQEGLVLPSDNKEDWAKMSAARKNN
ncbi:hypothetical protein [Kaarinaea lacus]